VTGGRRAPAPWWGRFEIPDGQAGRWRIGPFTLSAHWRPPEWRVARESAGDLLDDVVAVDCPADPDAVEPRGELVRIAPATPRGVLAITPKLADRPVVARPETTFRLLPGAQIDLFVSTPVWLEVGIGEPPQTILDEASWRLSDTWFGAVTGPGELCYAIHTAARLRLENLPVLPHRAVTKVRLENRAGETVSLERLNLPFPHLSLYADAGGHLWTQVVSVRLEAADKLAEVDLGEGPPGEAREPKRVAGPRLVVHRNILVRAKSAMLD
jgi:hypothetical protein